jgi:ABC-type multidrug transport system ATPase subunit
LRSVVLDVDNGETLLLVGSNGSGKTTLLKLLAGAIAPTFGTAQIFGHDLVRDRGELRSSVGLLSAQSYLYDDLSASENLEFVLKMSGRKGGPSHAVSDALDEVGLLGRSSDRVRLFSTGMRQRLALARLLLLDPHLMLLDEPYNGLDADGMTFVDTKIGEAKSRGRTIVLATHDRGRALPLADRLAVLDRGTLVSISTGGRPAEGPVGLA